MLSHFLQNELASPVAMITPVEFEEYNNAISWKDSPLHDVYAVCDGLKLQLEQSLEYIFQNKF